MSDDPLLQALRKVAQDQHRSPAGDERYEALAHEPLSEAARERLVDLIARPRSSAKAKATRPRRVALWSGGATALAAAAALVLWLRSPGAPLPAYEASFEGGEQALRGDPPPSSSSAPARIPRGGRIDLVLRPTRPVETTVAARAFAVRPGDARELRAALAISGDGAARLAGRRDEILADLPPGTWEIVLVVGRPGSLPDAAAIGGSSYAPPEDVRIARKTVILPAD